MNVFGYICLILVAALLGVIIGGIVGFTLLGMGVGVNGI